MDDNSCNRLGGERISDRQIDELIGLARGLAADGVINQAEVEFLQTWLAANLSISSNALIRTLYRRVDQMLADGVADETERTELLETLNAFSRRDSELGEVFKATTLPLCNPPPPLVFSRRCYTFTGTFNFGSRKECEAAVKARGAEIGALTRRTHYLVIGTYATDSWKHSSFGNKILKACEYRDAGLPISIVSEAHWIAAIQAFSLPLAREGEAG